jgi:hypothetical protein
MAADGDVRGEDVLGRPTGGFGVFGAHGLRLLRR